MVKINKKYTVVDLFSGCGGFSQGFEAAGFKVVAANEFWEPAQVTYAYNHKEVKFIKGDVTLKETKKQLYDAVGDQKINVIIGGPPCQAYSAAGNRNPDDPRGQLYLEFAEIIDHLKPDFFIMENVKGLTHMKHVKPKLTPKELKVFKRSCSELQKYKDLKRYRAQRTLDSEEEKDFQRLKGNLKEIDREIEKQLIPLIDKIKAKFEEINYKVSMEVLNSADYGVGQTRQRVIFIGTKHDNVRITFPNKTHSNKTSQKSLRSYVTDDSNAKQWITASEILKKYENWEENKENSHLFTKHKKEFVERIKNTPIGGNVYKNYSDAWWRLDPDKPSRTVKENHGGVFVHYKFDRVCTPRELAALQSFDDEFTFKGSKSSILKQIGNAVPPLMAKAIALKIKDLLNDLNINK
ncbi:MAG: DNA cytosine methyltransferase [Promethearchaeota archaeon]